MNNKIKLLCLSMLWAVISCATNENPVAENDVKSGVSHMATVATDDGCLDRKMDFWFSKFNQLQAEGYDMYEANEKATAVAAEQFKECDEKTGERMASEEATSSDEDDE
jgi:hypothetical protein